MRRRITRTLLAAAATGVTVSTLGFTAAGAASAAVATKAQPATIGTSIASTTSAGYQASGRDFRYISSTITVPDTDFLTGLYPQEYIQLSNGSLTQFSGGGDQYVRAGIESCRVAQSFGYTCTNGTWVAYIEAFNNSLNGPYFSHYAQLAGVNQGDGVNFSIYYDEQGNELHFVITPPTYSGAKGSFTGPWTTSKVVATSNGLLPPSGTTRVSPSTLWTDGLPANGPQLVPSQPGPARQTGPGRSSSQPTQPVQAVPAIY